jgi:Domain of unknown function (DUF4350)
MAAALRRCGVFVNARRTLIAALVVIAAGAGAWWLYANFERATERVWVGFRGKARTDPYLAAQRLLERMGVSTQTVRAIPALRTLSPKATLVLPQARHAITTALQQEILNWVEDGGHLIIEAEPIHQPDPLLDALAVRRAEMALNEETEDAEEEAQDKKLEPSDVEKRLRNQGTDIVEIDVPQGLAPVKVRMSQHLSLYAESAVARFGASATTLLFIEHGVGLVSVMNDFGSLSNYLIGENDHAEFLWRLVQLEPDSREVWFFNNPQRLSLIEWLWRNAWAALAGGTALLLLWLWRTAPRFGPIEPDPERSRRRLLDHLRASGRFLWSKGGAQKLIEAARESCLRRVMRAHPDLLATPESEREARLMEVLGLSSEQARKLLVPGQTLRIIDFLQTVRLYQEVHEHLARRRTPTERK